ncbi:hypothetical protein [Nitratireductor soli]|uniref:hypothetical protein n=1 Tax=Nitratireductor soli TaxID=1670619 RepID=UPI000B19160B|nr:hypothetical protein [Nitratireductor soli]
MLPLLRGRKLLVDSNLLVLLCVGNAGENYISSHKRLRAFDVTDFELLQKIVRDAAQLSILPNIATETSNLIRHFALPVRDRFSEVLKRMTLEFFEFSVPSRSAVEQPDYARLGLTDAAILKALERERDLMLITSDLGLYLAAMQRDFDAVNFNHLKEQRPDLS